MGIVDKSVSGRYLGLSLVSVLVSISGAQDEALGGTSTYPVVVPMVSVDGKESKLPSAFEIGEWQCYAASKYKVMNEGFGDIPYLDLGVVCKSGVGKREVIVSLSRICWLSRDDFGWAKNVSSSVAKLEAVSVVLLCYTEK